MRAHVLVHVCDWCAVFLFVFLHAVHLRTGGTRAPVPGEDWVRDAGWSPLQTTPLYATPGCPQYLKTESINRGMMSREGAQRKEDIKREGGRKEKGGGSDQQVDRGKTEDKHFI